LLREGSRHSWWHNPELNKRSAVPKHKEISNVLAKKIFKDLGDVLDRDFGFFLSESFPNIDVNNWHF
jgi:hypothetical protein